MNASKRIIIETSNLKLVSTFVFNKHNAGLFTGFNVFVINEHNYHGNSIELSTHDETITTYQLSYGWRFITGELSMTR